MALFNASCTRLSLVGFPPQDIPTPFHRAIDVTRIQRKRYSTAMPMDISEISIICLVIP
jgi:hypothetical protein